MKKLLALLLSGLLLASFSACSDKDDSTKEDMKDYLQQEEQADHETVADETFYFENVDSETVRITKYEGVDTPHAVKIPEKLDGKTVVAIADSAFYYHSNISSITLPATVTSIGEYAFAGCTMLTDLTVPATVETIGEAAFFGCTAMKSLTFASNGKLTEIAKLTFSGCSALEKVSIPGTVKIIGTAAFFNCSSLAEVTVGEGTELIGAQAFQNCTALAELTLPGEPLANIGTMAFSGSENLYADGVTCPAGSPAETFINSMKLTEKAE